MIKSKWGKWTDISTGAVHEVRYLLQARRHKNGKVQFRVEKSAAAWDCNKPTMLSYNQIIKLNREFAEAHMLIKSFGNGKVYSADKHSQQDWFGYPAMWMEDLPNPVNDKEYTYTFRVNFVQQVATLKERRGDQLTVNISEAKSDMISCARDLLAFWAKDSNYSDLDLIKNTVILPYEGETEWEDEVVGCYVDLKLKQAFKYNKCAIPMTGISRLFQLSNFRSFCLFKSIKKLWYNKQIRQGK